MENQGTNGDDSQSDPHPEAAIFRSQITQNCGREVGHDMVTGATEEICNLHDMVTGDTEEICNRHDMVTGATEELCNRQDMMTGATEDICNSHDMVTGVTEQIRNRHDMVTEIQENIPYCSLGTSSGKQKKTRSTSQPPFRSENTSATIEADQILLAPQQLASNIISANINNNVNKISKLSKSLTTAMPTFDGKSKNFELFEAVLQTSLKIHNQLTEEDKIN